MIGNHRAHSQQLSSLTHSRVADLVRWMGAIQAQEYRMSKWAIGMRLDGGTLNQVNAAIDSGEILRSHLLRPTWHWVAAEDYRWILKLCGDRLRSSYRSWGKTVGLTEELYAELVPQIEKILSGRSLERVEIQTELARLGTEMDIRYVSWMLGLAETAGLVCSGADRGGKPTYALLDERVPSGSDMTLEEACAELARRYFQSHSPATIDDFVWWSGLPVTQVRKALAAIRPECVVEVRGGVEYVFYGSGEKPKVPKCVQLLPAFDEFLISYKDRSASIASIHEPHAYNRYGTFYPVVLYHGRIVGKWRDIGAKKPIEFTYFNLPKRASEKAIADAVKRYRRFQEK